MTARVARVPRVARVARVARVPRVPRVPRVAGRRRRWVASDAVRYWFTRRSLLLHLTVAVVVPGFLALAWWQLNRAEGGNELSWAYTFEWPFFAGYAVFIWWKLVHDQKHPEQSPSVLSEPALRPVGWALQARRQRSTRQHRARPTVAQLAAMALAEAGGGEVGALAASAGKAGFPTAAGATPASAAGPEAAAAAAAHLGAAAPSTTLAGAVPSATATGATFPGTAAPGAAAPGAAPDATATPPRPVIPTLDDPDLSDEDRELAEYNAYLAALSASGRRKRW